jgi:hypothetical protein
MCIMDGPWYQISGPTSQEVLDILLEKGFSRSQAKRAMDHVDNKFGSWSGFHIFQLPKMIMYLNTIE